MTAIFFFGFSTFLLSLLDFFLSYFFSADLDFGSDFFGDLDGKEDFFIFFYGIGDFDLYGVFIVFIF